MSVTIRRTALALGLTVVLVATVWLIVAARLPSSVAQPQPATLPRGMCLNPTLAFDGRNWLTDDRIPRGSMDRLPLNGMFAVDGDTAVFVGPDGVLLNYRVWDDFEKLNCFIG